MADYGQLDEELDDLARGVDLDAVTQRVQAGLSLADVDEQLAALAEGVEIPEPAAHRASRSFAPPKMSEADQRAAAAEHQAEVGEVDQAWGNLNAALTPSDLEELAALEVEGSRISEPPVQPDMPGSVPPGSIPPGSVRPGSVRPGSVRPASAAPGSIPPPSIPPMSAPGSVPPAAASEPPAPDAADSSLDALTPLAPLPPPTSTGQPHPFASAPPPNASVPPPPPGSGVFSDEDIAAIRASTPPPVGDLGSVEVEIGEVEEIALDDMELIEFDDFEEFDEAEGTEEEQAATDTAPEDAAVAADAAAAADAPDADAAVDAADDEPSDPGEKKGFFKKIFG